MTTSFASLNSADSLSKFFSERGFLAESAPADSIFDLPVNHADKLQGSRIVALAGLDANDNVLVVLYVPRASLPLEVLYRIRRQLGMSLRDGLVVCTENWQQARLYLLSQADIPAEGSGNGPTPSEWDLNLQVPRLSDLQALDLLDIRKVSLFEVTEVLQKAFRRAARTTLYHNQGLFSNYYLNERLEQDSEAHNQAWRDLANTVSALRPVVDAALRAGASAVDLQKTEQLVLSPLLKALGWEFTKADNTGELELRQAGTTVAFCQLVPFGDSLEQAILHHGLPLAPTLALSGKLAAQKDVQWGILTNGCIWRLVSTQASSTSGVFYEVDLADIVAIGASDNRDLRWFRAFFGADWLYAPKNQVALLNMLYQSGQIWAEQLGEDLKQAIFRDVFVDFANALIEGARRSGFNPNLKLIYRATLILLYRLLFVLYAESRRLLPTTSSAYYPHSLTFILSTLALKKQGLVPANTYFSLDTSDKRLWQYLRDLFAAIGTGKAEWNIPHYNGGLFADTSSAAHAFLADLDQVATDYFADALDKLARDQAARDAKDEHSALRLIDYMDLNVRRLGSIYEGLLEFQLQVADQDGLIVNGQFVPAGESSTSSKGRKSSKNSGRSISANELYLENTRQDRKASGSYYTPDYIVKYIVEQTVGPVLEQRAKRFADQINSLRSLRTQASRTNDSGVAQHLRQRIEQEEHAAIETLLDIKVLDPAMGSGHFLVEAVNYLSDHLSTILHKYPDNPLLARLQKIRADIRKNLLEQGIKADVILDDQLSDRVLLRRMVMKRCIYGVDLNEMAVDLAKLSLWLDSFAIGAPLSFLDHHLRWGNSLIGIWDVKDYIDFTSARGHQFINALGHMVQVTQLSDSTSAEVADSKQLYAAAQEGLRPFREQLHVDLATHFVDLGDISHARRVARTPIADRTNPAIVEIESLEKFKKAQQAADERRFFHWKLEFPEVFVDYNKRDWKTKEEAGFDAVIGNPPYISAWSMTNIDSSHRNALVKTLQMKQFLTGHWDLYLAFMLKAFDWTSSGNGFSFIIPNPFCREKYATAARRFLLENTYISSILSFGEQNVFDDVSRQTLVPVFKKSQALEHEQTHLENLSIDSHGNLQTIRTSIHQSNFLKNDGAQIIYNLNTKSLDLKDKIGNYSDKIGNICYVNYGAQISSKEKGRFGKDDVLSLYPIGNSKRFFDGKNINRYEISWDGRYLDYRPQELYGPRSTELFESKKITVRDVTGEGLRLIVSYDDEHLYCDHLIVCITYYENVVNTGVQTNFDEYIRKNPPYPSLLYLTSLLGSTLLSWLFSKFIATDSLQGSYSHTYPQQIRAFPYRIINFTTEESLRKSAFGNYHRLRDET